MLIRDRRGVRPPPALGYPAGPHPRIWPTAEPNAATWDPRRREESEARGGFPRPSAVQYPEGPLSASKTFPRASSGGHVRADLLVDQLDQLGAESERALERGVLDPLGRVAVAVEVRSVVAVVTAGDRERREAGASSRHGVVHRPDCHRARPVATVVRVLVGELLAERAQARVRLRTQQRSLPARVADGPAADRVHVEEDRARGVELAAVVAHP